MIRNDYHVGDIMRTQGGVLEWKSCEKNQRCKYGPGRAWMGSEGADGTAGQGVVTAEGGMGGCDVPCDFLLGHCHDVFSGYFDKGGVWTKDSFG